MRVQENSLYAEILLSKRLRNHDIWCYCGAFWLKNSEYLLAGNATIHGCEYTVVPKMDAVGFFLYK